MWKGLRSATNTGREHSVVWATWPGPAFDQCQRTYLHLDPRQSHDCGLGTWLRRFGLQRKRAVVRAPGPDSVGDTCVSSGPGLGTAARPAGHRELLYPSVLAAGSS